LWYETTPPTQSPYALRQVRGPTLIAPKSLIIRGLQPADNLRTQESQVGRTSQSVTLFYKLKKNQKAGKDGTTEKPSQRS